MRKIILGILILGSSWVSAQKISDLQINPLLVDPQFVVLKDAQALKPFFRKLEDLEQGKRSQVTIVQIGDSHVQGPFFPQAIRDSLQKRFGNSGRGFTFPYRVAQTNGATDVKYKSSTDWKSVRNVKSNGSDDVGLSGIYLSTTNADFVLQIDLPRDFETQDFIQIISPTPESFKLSTSTSSDVVRIVDATTSYKVRSGDNLGAIAGKYGSSVSKIQKANGMRSTRINIGQTLKIPSGKKQSIVKESSFIDISRLPNGDFPLPKNTRTLYLRAAKNQKEYLLDGVNFKRKSNGISFHAIGVNGAKYSDYTKFDRFFKQLEALKPDLIIVSLGTNESFYDTYTEGDLMKDMDAFNRKLIAKNMNAPVIATSPPPSMKNRKNINDIATVYSYQMGVFANLNSWAFFDLHSATRTSNAMPDWYTANLTSSDKIHFNRLGYELQAHLFVQSLLKSFKESQ
ncbi:LysM peptidoglycan-binding domain-containing protein [Nonlabens antarcticus]|uniref:LysM peptidoglycan-binding domain-containing protein n=1 Tax=Nonlabens antarcticus TaxID=392714 RepID=UPI0018911911|nr:LysM peptidoglycan-binding domain-containing protein [Nonlabens antarcticus]